MEVKELEKLIEKNSDRIPLINEPQHEALVINNKLLLEILKEIRSK